MSRGDRSPRSCWLQGAGSRIRLPSRWPCPAPGDVVATVFLIGDAGSPAPGGEPVLEALTHDASLARGRGTIVFLGDNVYPRGIPDSFAPSRADAERRLREQMAVVRETGARGIFVPGNHDWAKHAASGWDAIRRQGALIAADSGPMVMLPAGGCPGPAMADVGNRFRLVFLDTQWWLHKGPKPGPANSACSPSTPEGIVDSLRGLIASAGSLRRRRHRAPSSSLGRNPRRTLHVERPSLSAPCRGAVALDSAAGTGLDLPGCPPARRVVPGRFRIGQPSDARGSGVRVR